MSNCYVYYRVALERDDDARRAIHAMLDEVEVETGIRGVAYRKTTEPLLWMEAYSRVTDSEAFVSLLTQLSSRHGLDACLEANQRRHVEEFVPLNLTLPA